MGVTCSKYAAGMDGSGSGGGGGIVGGSGNGGADHPSAATLLLQHRHDPYAATGGIPDAEIYDFLRRSVALTQQQQQQQQPLQSPASAPFKSMSLPSTSPFRLLRHNHTNVNSTAGAASGQFHLLYKQQSQHPAQQQYCHPHQRQQQKQSNSSKGHSPKQTSPTAVPQSSSSSSSSTLHRPSYQPQQQPQYPTRLVMRRHPVRTSTEEGVSGTHIYAVRWTDDANPKPLRRAIQDHPHLHRPEQCPPPLSATKKKKKSIVQPTMSITTTTSPISPVSNVTFAMSTEDKDTFDIEIDTTAIDPFKDNTTTKNVPMDANVLVGTYGGPDKDNATTFVGSSSCNRRLEDRRITSSTAAITTSSDHDALVVDELSSSSSDSSSCALSVDNLFRAAAMAAPPKRNVADWVTVSAEHSIYVADVGLSVSECNYIVSVTEQQCRGQYAAYTYAKQTLGCREYPALAVAVQGAVHTVVSAIMEQQEQQSHQRYEYNDNSDSTTSSSCASKIKLVLDDREPHMVKYDVTKKERQKLDMHTDKSEWTFLIAVSNGAGVDYTGGGTYFECLDATVHVQRGHALIFPGKLRHCGQRITAGLRFLLVGFLVDKTPKPQPALTAAGFSEIDDMHKYACNVP